MLVLYLAIVSLAVLAALLAGPFLFGRFFMPRLTLALLRSCGKWLYKLLDRISPGLGMKLLVEAGNRYYHDSYAATPYEERMLLLPYCLRPADCQIKVDREVGLICEEACWKARPNCTLGQVQAEALALGYAQVFVVPSARLMPKEGLMPSDQFIKAKIRQHAPAAVLGVVCDWNLRTRLLPKHTAGRHGYSTGAGQQAVLQGVLLDGHNCLRATVDWEEVRRRLCLRA